MSLFVNSTELLIIVRVFVVRTPLFHHPTRTIDRTAGAGLWDNVVARLKLRGYTTSTCRNR